MIEHGGGGGSEGVASAECCEPATDYTGQVLLVGDVVKLRNKNSPMLTVEFVDDRSSLVSCIWFDSESHQQRGNFIGKTLLKVPEPVH